MQNTKDLIKQYYDCFNRQDMETFINLLDENVIHDINQGGKEVGKEAFAKFMKHMNHCYKETAKDLEVMVSEDGTRAAAEFIIDGNYIATDKGLPEAKNQHYYLPCGTFFRIKNGKIAHVTMFYNIKDWIRQVGG